MSLSHVPHTYRPHPTRTHTSYPHAHTHTSPYTCTPLSHTRTPHAHLPHTHTQLLSPHTPPNPHAHLLTRTHTSPYARTPPSHTHPHTHLSTRTPLHPHAHLPTRTHTHARTPPPHTHLMMTRCAKLMQKSSSGIQNSPDATQSRGRQCARNAGLTRDHDASLLHREWVKPEVDQTGSRLDRNWVCVSGSSEMETFSTREALYQNVSAPEVVPTGSDLERKCYVPQ